MYTNPSQIVTFTYTYGDRVITIKSESVLLSELLEDFKSFCLAVGHASSNVESIDFVDREEV